MGGPGQEFKYQGDCQRDWRQVWERTLLAELDWRLSRRTLEPLETGETN